MPDMRILTALSQVMMENGVRSASDVKKQAHIEPHKSTITMATTFDAVIDADHQRTRAILLTVDAEIYDRIMNQLKQINT